MVGVAVLVVGGVDLMCRVVSACKVDLVRGVDLVRRVDVVRAVDLVVSAQGGAV